MLIFFQKVKKKYYAHFQSWHGLPTEAGDREWYCHEAGDGGRYYHAHRLH